MTKRPTVTLCMIVKMKNTLSPSVLNLFTSISTDMISLILDLAIERKKSSKSFLMKSKSPVKFMNPTGKVSENPELSLFKTQKKVECDYAWVIDADDRVEGNFKYPKPEDMTADSYALNIHRGEFNWWRNQIFKLSSGWRYVGVLHEYAECKGKTEKGEQAITIQLKGNYHIDANDGCKNCPVW